MQSTVDLTGNVSNLIESQFPQFYQDEESYLVKFVKLYYLWLESTNQVNDDLRNFLLNQDVDDAFYNFVNDFKNKYLTLLPVNIDTDIRFFTKHAKDLWNSKGTSRGFELLFKLLYNKNVNIYLPKDDIFKPSDNTWYAPNYLEISASSLSVSLVGQIIKGTSSSSTAFVEDYLQRVVNGKIINVFIISNISGAFTVGEKILNIDNTNATSITNSPKILGSVTSIEIIQGGQNFTIGDSLVAITGNGIENIGRVSSIANGTGTLKFSILSGGSGYSTANAVSIISRVPANGTISGRAASFKIGQITNIVPITYDNDLLYDDSFTNIGANGVSNISIISGGQNYSNTTANVTVTPAYSVDYVNIISQGNSYSNGDVVNFTGLYGNGFIVTDNFGSILAVDIENPGRSPNPNTSYSITSNTGINANINLLLSNSGSGANVIVSTDSVNGTIQNYHIYNQGSGYRVPPYISVYGGNGNANLQSYVLCGQEYQPIGSYSNFITDNFGTIASLTKIATGNNYITNPIITVTDAMVSVNQIPGEIFFANNNATLNGANTTFTSYLANGYIIKIIADPPFNTLVDYRIINNIVNDTTLVLDDFPNLPMCNGEIYAATIDNSGVNYSNNDIVNIIGIGSGANVTLVTDTSGRIAKLNINAQGTGYYQLPTITITSNTGSGGIIMPSVYIPAIFVTNDILFANFTENNSIYSLMTANGSSAANNANIIAVPQFGTGIINQIQIKNSGYSYQQNEIVQFATGEAIASIEITNGGTGYVNNEIVIFNGGSFTSAANAFITTNSNSSITNINVTYPGSGYQVSPTIVFASRNGHGASALATVGGLGTTYYITGIANLSGVGISKGVWLNDKSFASDNKYIQDSYYYQDFSYVLKSSVNPLLYSKIIKDNFHPSGSQMFGEYLLTETITISYNPIVNESIIL